MGKQYVEERDNGYWIAGTRVSLDSLVIAFLEGRSPEAIAGECFAVLTLEQVYGGSAYYLSHRAEIDTYLQQAKAKFEALRPAIRQADLSFPARLARARRQATTLYGLPL